MIETNQEMETSPERNDLHHSNFEEMLEMVNTTSDPVKAYQLAIRTLEQANAQKNEKQVAQVQLLLVSILIKNGAYKEALKINIEVLDFFQKEKMLSEEAKGWRYMAIIYKFLGDFQKQLEYNKKCLAITQQLNNSLEEIQILNNIGDTYLNLGLLDEAIEVFKTNQNNPKACNLLKGVSIKNLGKVYYEKKEYLKAELTLKESHKLGIDHDISILCIASDSYLGKVYLALGKYYLACKHLELAAASLEKKVTLPKEYKDVLEALVKGLISLGASEKAADYFKKYTEVSKAIAGQVKDQFTRNIRFKFEMNEVEKKRLLLEEQNKVLKEANDKIRIQSKALQEKTVALEEANQELQNFAHIVSHDIKQPIRTISNFSKLLEREVKDHLTENGKEFMDIIRSSTKSVTVFVDDILQYATSTQTKTKMELVDCNKMLDQVKLNLEIQIKESKGQLIYNNLPTIKAHHSLMLQVFQNLISNALKFRKKDVSPIVKISATETERNIIFSIEDNGIGIQEEYQEKVFEMFQKLNNKNDFEGSGIGLNTVLKIIKKYNGTIGLESEFGKGTIFNITFPKGE